MGYLSNLVGNNDLKKKKKKGRMECSCKSFKMTIIVKESLLVQKVGGGGTKNENDLFAKYLRQKAYD